MSYKDLFNDQSANLAAQDHIPAATGGWMAEAVGINVGMTNFRSFLETGKMHFRGYEGEIHIDMSKDDALMKSLKTALDDAHQELIETDAYKDFIEADPPTLNQRLAYEQELSRVSFQAIEGIDGLTKYRLDAGAMDGMYSQSSNEIKSDNNLNSLSADIEGRADSTQSYRTDFECEKMSALKGMLMQSIEDAVLPEDDGTIKSAGSYFNALGGMYMVQEFISPELSEVMEGDMDVTRGWHAFVTSSKSGAVFEATAVENSEDSEALYGANRMLIPLTFDGHLPEQAPYNYNFATLAAGMRVAYVPMDPENPGRVQELAGYNDIRSYQVGSNDQLSIDRMMAIESGNLEEMENLRKNIPQMSMDGYKNDLRFAAADLISRKIVQKFDDHLGKFDPDMDGGHNFMLNVAEEEIYDFAGIPDSLMRAHEEYVSQGKEIPQELLQEIADQDTWSVTYLDSKLDEMATNIGKMQEAVPAYVKGELVKAGFEEEYATVYAENLKYQVWPEQLASLDEARTLSESLKNIAYKAQELNPEFAMDTEGVVTMEGDQNTSAQDATPLEEEPKMAQASVTNPSTTPM